MKLETWLARNTSSLRGKTVAVTGSTGGLGRALCRCLAALEAELILLDRNPQRAREADGALREEFPSVRIRRIPLDLEDFSTVRAAVNALRSCPVDVLILNAGAYSIPRKTCSTGLDNVFQINFAAPYYLVRELMPLLRERGGRVVAVGSIAHGYSKTDPRDVDFSTRRRASLVYGNAKRYLMAALPALFEEEERASLAVVHPGITLTGITAHYPPLVFALIKHPMRVIFMSPNKAVLSIVKGIFTPTPRGSWIGPRVLRVWGFPKRSPLRSIGKDEERQILLRAEEIYQRLSAK